MSGGAGSPPHPPAWLDVARGVFFWWLKAAGSRTFPQQPCLGDGSGSLQVWNSSQAALGRGFLAPPKAGRSPVRVAGCPASLPAATAAEIHPACSPFLTFFFFILS